MGALTDKQIKAMHEYRGYLAGRKSAGLDFAGTPSSFYDNVSYSEIVKNGQTTYVYSLTGNSPYSTNEILGAITGQYSEANMMTLFETVPELFAIVDAVASRVRNGEYTLVDKAGQQVEDNKLWEQISKNPNWQYTFKELIWHAVAYKMVTGNRYLYSYAPESLKLSHKSIMALWLLPSHYMWITMLPERPVFLMTTSKDQFIKSYDLRVTGSGPVHLQPETVTHQIAVKMGNANDVITGKGTGIFRACVAPMSNIIACYAARGKIFLQGGPTGVIVSKVSDSMGTNMKLTPEEKANLYSDVYGRHGYGSNQVPNAITDTPVDFVKIGSQLKEMQPYDEILHDTVIIAGVAGVPMALIPKTSENKQTNNDTAERDFYYNRIIPEAQEVCELLTKACRFDEIGCKVAVSFDDVPALQDDAAKSAAAYKDNSTAALSLYNSKIITENQVRESCGFEPVEGGDSYIEVPEKEIEPNQQTDNNG